MEEKTPIVQLFYGKIGNQENIKVDTEEYRRFLDELIEVDEQISQKTKGLEDIYELYKKATDLLEGMMNEEIDVYYSEGIRTGVLIGMDVAGYFK